MTEFEKRLSDALADREEQIDVDPQAWQTHLDLVQAQHHSAPGRSAGAGRWRAPALVAASVVAVGLVGGIIAQSGLLGGPAVNPAGGHTPAVTVSTVPSTRHSAPAPNAGRAQTPPPPEHAAGPTSPRIARTTETTPPSSADRPNTGNAPLAALSTERPPQSSGSAELPPAVTTTMSAPVRTTIADGAGTGPQATTLVDLGAQAQAREDHAAEILTAQSQARKDRKDLAVLMPCGERLTDLDEIAAVTAVQVGPNVGIVNDNAQPLSVLAVGYVVLDGDGRVASRSGGDESLTTAAAITLPDGHSDHEASIVPIGLCDVTTASDGSTASSVPRPSVILQVDLRDSLPPGTYSAVDIVLVGTDLQHATAYRTGEVWQFETG